MRLLLDTHVFLWCAANDPQLGPVAREAIESPDSFVAISAAVAWELEIKRALKKVEAPPDLREQLELYRFDELPITISSPAATRSMSFERWVFASWMFTITSLV